MTAMTTEMSDVSDVAILLVPGYTNSGPQHWQSIWQQTHSEYHRVEQADWERPEILAWTGTLVRAIDEIPGRVVLVAHSLGCNTVLHGVLQYPTLVPKIAGALLVAPADVDQTMTPDVLRAFRPVPMHPVPFPSVLVASTTDSELSIDRAREFAIAWGAHLINIGDAGHINTAAGFGPWPQGQQILADLVADIIS